MRPGLAAFLVASFFLSRRAADPAAAPTGAVEWHGPAAARTTAGALESAAFNDYLDENPEHATAPVIAATRFLRLDRATAATTAIVAALVGGGLRARRR